MPIRIDDSNETPPVRPSTNAHELLSVLLDHPDMGFSPSELADLTNVPYSSVPKTLSRLEEKGLVRQVDSYWTVAGDVAASELGNLVSLQQIEAEYGDDTYGDDDQWADDAPDLGENA
jgi:DNA-binding transcriptional ArsR family regulator